MNIDVAFGITKKLLRTTMADARARIARSLIAEGFGILSEIDVQTTLETKLGVVFGPYVILGACNPKLAHRALTVEPGIGLLLPCNIVLCADGEDVVVSAASPQAMFAVARATPELEAVAQEAEERIRRAVMAA